MHVKTFKCFFQFLRDFWHIMHRHSFLRLVVVIVLRKESALVGISHFFRVYFDYAVNHRRMIAVYGRYFFYVFIFFDVVCDWKWNLAKTMDIWMERGIYIRCRIRRYRFRLFLNFSKVKRLNTWLVFSYSSSERN